MLLFHIILDNCNALFARLNQSSLNRFHTVLAFLHLSLIKLNVHCEILPLTFELSVAKHRGMFPTSFTCTFQIELSGQANKNYLPSKYKRALFKLSHQNNGILLHCILAVASLF